MKTFMRKWSDVLKGVKYMGKFSNVLQNHLVVIRGYDYMH